MKGITIIPKSKYVAVALCLCLLSGCDRDQVNAMKVDEGQSVSSTAVYFPGGIGVDFGEKPIRESVWVGANGRKSHYSVYEMQVDYEDFNSQLSKILSDDGYDQRAVNDARYIASYQFSKKGYSPIGVGYKERVVEGLIKIAIITFWWEASEG